MAKITLNDVNSGLNQASLTNSNNDTIETNLNDKVLYRDNPAGEANQMENLIDMNSERIINLPAPLSDGEPATRGFVDGLSIPADISAAKIFSTVALMAASTDLIVGNVVQTLGYIASGTGGSNLYEIVVAGTGTNDGGSFIDLAGSGHQAKGLFPGEIINDGQFGATGDGVVEDATALQALVTYLGTDNLYGELTPGKTYKISSTVSSVDKSLSLDGKGATLFQGATVGLLSFVGAWNDDTVVASHTATTITVAAAAAIFTTLAADLIHNPVIKIVSDDALATGDDASERRGEMVRVSAIDSGTGVITFLTDLVDTYTTSVRVAVLSKTVVDLKNIQFDSDSVSHTASMVFLESLNESRIENLTCKVNSAAFVFMRSCYAQVLKNVRGANLVDNQPTQLGYGIAIAACEHASIFGGSFYDTRHAITTDTGHTDAAGDIENYGATRYLHVIGARAFANSSDSFDTHPGDLDTIYEDCLSVGSLAAGYKSRSVGTKFINCTSVNEVFGIRASAGSDKLTLDGCHVQNCRSLALFVITDGSVDIYGGEFEGAGNANEVCRFEGGTDVKMYGSPVFKTSTSVNDSKGISLRGDSTVWAESLTVDVTGISGLRFRALEFNSGTANVFEIDKFNYKFPSGVSIDPVCEVVAETTNQIRIHDARLSTLLALTTGAVSADSGWRFVTDNGFSSESFAVAVGADDPALTDSVLHSLESRINLRCNTTVASDFGAIPEGSAEGQILMVLNRKDSTQNLTIEDGASGNTSLTAGDVVLTAGQAILLEYDGAVWDQFTVV